ncbi:MAG TPA: response regulator, partial [Thermogutta sp.]|nr:response regulator [Thermogutta sp.]
MSHVLRVAIVDPHDAGREELKRLLLGLDSIWLEAECSRYEFFADVVAQTNPEIGIVALDFDQEKALDLVSKVTQQSPDCAIFVVSSSHDGTVILKAMRAGAKEFLPQPVRIDDLLAAIERLTERRFGRGDQKARGSTVIAMTGVTGGVGVSTIAVNLGCALARNDKNSVVLVDLDLCLGDADVLLDAIPDYTIVDVAQNVTRLDFSLLKRSLTKHSSGLFLLPRPIQLEDVALVSAEDIQRVVGLLKASFTHLVMDLSKAFTPLDMMAMEMAQHIVLVTQLDLPCLRNVVRLLMSF